MKLPKPLPIDIIEANLMAIERHKTELEIEYLKGKMPKSLYSYKLMNLDIESVYFKHCAKLTNRKAAK